MAAKARIGRVRRVLLVTPRLLDSSGGRAATDLALRLDRRRVEPAVCCYDGWGPLARELLEAGIEIFDFIREGLPRRHEEHERTECQMTKNECPITARLSAFALCRS